MQKPAGKSLPYWHPALYRLAEVPRQGRRNVRKRIRDLIGPNKRVFQPGCLWGELAGYLDPSCQYRGIDLIEGFVRHGQRKGLNLCLQDPVHGPPYPPSDAVVVIDRLHHLLPDEPKAMLERALDAAPLVLVVEPTFLGWTKLPAVGGIVDWFFTAFDRNGVNPIFTWYSKAEYQHEFSRLFGLERSGVQLELTEVGSNLLAVYRQPS